MANIARDSRNVPQDGVARGLVTRSIALGLLFLTAAVGCGSMHRTGVGAVVSDRGRIGPLRMDRSDRAEVIAFAGRPDVERRGEFFLTPYLALGYDCFAKRSDDRFSVREATVGGSGPYCKTIYWINQRTGRLGDF